MKKEWSYIRDRIREIQPGQCVDPDVVLKYEITLIRAGLQPDDESLRLGLDTFNSFPWDLLSGDRQRARVRMLLRLGRISDQLGEWKTALGCFDQAAKLAREFCERQLEAIALMESGELYRRSGRLQLSVQCQERAIELACKENLLREQADALNNLANTMTEMGNIDHALSCFSDSITIAEKIHDARIEGHVYNNLGVIRCMQGNYREGLAEFSRALAKRNQVKDKRGIAETYHNMSMAHKDLEEYDQADIFVHNAMTYASDIAHLGLITNITITSIEIEIIRQDYSYASSLAQTALKNSEILGDQHAKAEITKLMGMIHLQQNNLPEAEHHLRAAIELFADLKIPLGEAESCELFAGYLKKKNDLVSATEMIRRAQTVYRSIGNLQKAQQLDGI